MNKRKCLLFCSICITFTACSNTNVPVAPISPNYQLGASDGCKTAKGTYTKNSNSFRTYKAYADGWFRGRRDCNQVRNKS